MNRFDASKPIGNGTIDFNNLEYFDYKQLYRDTMRGHNIFSNDELLNIIRGLPQPMANAIVQTTSSRLQAPNSVERMGYEFAKQRDTAIVEDDSATVPAVNDYYQGTDPGGIQRFVDRLQGTGGGLSRYLVKWSGLYEGGDMPELILFDKQTRTLLRDFTPAQYIEANKEELGKTFVGQRIIENYVGGRYDDVADAQEFANLYYRDLIQAELDQKAQISTGSKVGDFATDIVGSVADPVGILTGAVASKLAFAGAGALWQRTLAKELLENNQSAKALLLASKFTAKPSFVGTVGTVVADSALQSFVTESLMASDYNYDFSVDNVVYGALVDSALHGVFALAGGRIADLIPPYKKALAERAKVDVDAVGGSDAGDLTDLDKVLDDLNDILATTPEQKQRLVEERKKRSDNDIRERNEAFAEMREPVIEKVNTDELVRELTVQNLQEPKVLNLLPPSYRKELTEVYNRFENAFKNYEVGRPNDFVVDLESVENVADRERVDARNDEIRKVLDPIAQDTTGSFRDRVLNAIQALRLATRTAENQRGTINRDAIDNLMAELDKYDPSITNKGNVDNLRKIVLNRATTDSPIESLDDYMADRSNDKVKTIFDRLFSNSRKLGDRFVQNAPVFSRTLNKFLRNVRNGRISLAHNLTFLKFIVNQNPIINALGNTILDPVLPMVGSVKGTIASRLSLDRFVNTVSARKRQGFAVLVNEFERFALFAESKGVLQFGELAEAKFLKLQDRVAKLAEKATDFRVQTKDYSDNLAKFLRMLELMRVDRRFNELFAGIGEEDFEALIRHNTPSQLSVDTAKVARVLEDMAEFPAYFKDVLSESGFVDKGNNFNLTDPEVRQYIASMYARLSRAGMMNPSYISGKLSIFNKDFRRIFDAFTSVQIAYRTPLVNNSTITIDILNNLMREFVGVRESPRLRSLDGIEKFLTDNDIGVTFDEVLEAFTDPADGKISNDLNATRNGLLRLIVDGFNRSSSSLVSLDKVHRIRQGTAGPFDAFNIKTRSAWLDYDISRTVDKVSKLSAGIYNVRQMLQRLVEMNALNLKEGKDFVGKSVDGNSVPVNKGIFEDLVLRGTKLLDDFEVIVTQGTDIRERINNSRRLGVEQYKLVVSELRNDVMSDTQLDEPLRTMTLERYDKILDVIDNVQNGMANEETYGQFLVDYLTLKETAGLGLPPLSSFVDRFVGQQAETIDMIGRTDRFVIDSLDAMLDHAKNTAVRSNGAINVGDTIDDIQDFKDYIYPFLGLRETAKPYSQGQNVLKIVDGLVLGKTGLTNLIDLYGKSLSMNFLIGRMDGWRAVVRTLGQTLNAFNLSGNALQRKSAQRDLGLIIETMRSHLDDVNTILERMTDSNNAILLDNREGGASVLSNFANLYRGLIGKLSATQFVANVTKSVNIRSAISLLHGDSGLINNGAMLIETMRKRNVGLAEAIALNSDKPRINSNTFAFVQKLFSVMSHDDILALDELLRRKKDAYDIRVLTDDSGTLRNFESSIEGREKAEFTEAEARLLRNYAMTIDYFVENVFASQSSAQANLLIAEPSGFLNKILTRFFKTAFQANIGSASGIGMANFDHRTSATAYATCVAGAIYLLKAYLRSPEDFEKEATKATTLRGGIEILQNATEQSGTTDAILSQLLSLGLDVTSPNSWDRMNAGEFQLQGPIVGTGLKAIEATGLAYQMFTEGKELTPSQRRLLRKFVYLNVFETTFGSLFGKGMISVNNKYIKDADIKDALDFLLIDDKAKNRKSKLEDFQWEFYK